MEISRKKKLHREIEHVESPKDTRLSPAHKEVLNTCVGPKRRRNWFNARTYIEKVLCKELLQRGFLQVMAITLMNGDWYCITEAGCDELGLTFSDKRNVLGKGNLKAKGEKQ